MSTERKWTIRQELTDTQEKDYLTAVLEKRAVCFSSIEALNYRLERGGVISGDPLKDKKNLYQTRDLMVKVPASIERARAHLALVEARLEKVERERQEAMARAEEYCSEVARKERYVKQIEKLFLSGVLTENEMEEVRSELRIFKALPGRDPQLKADLKIRRQCLKETEEGLVAVRVVPLPVIEEQPVIPEIGVTGLEGAKKLEKGALPVLILDLEKQELELYGSRLKLTPLEKAFLLAFKKRGRQVHTDEELDKVLRRAGSQDQRVVANTSFRLRAKINPGQGEPAVLVKKEDGWQLDAKLVLITEDDKTRCYKESKKIFEVALPDGLVVKIQGGVTAEILMQLVEVWPSLVNINDLKGARGSAGILIGPLGGILEPAGWQIIHELTKEKKLDKNRRQRTVRVSQYGLKKIEETPIEVLEAKVKQLEELVESGDLDPEELKLHEEFLSQERARRQVAKGAKTSVNKERSQRTKEAAQIFQVSLPDGQVISVRGKVSADILKELIAAWPDYIQSDVLARTIYGAYEKSSNKFSAAVRHAGGSLKDAKWRIDQPVLPQERAKGKIGKYALKKVGETPEGGAVDKPAGPQVLQRGPQIEHESNPGVLEITESQEVRQMRITKAILEAIEEGTRRSGRIMILEYPQLQADIIKAEPEESRISRIREIAGRPAMEYYSGRELSEAVKGVFLTLSVQSRSAAGRSKWTEQEGLAWKALQDLRKQLHAGEAKRFLKMMEEIVTQAERVFFSQHRKINGGNWVSLAP